jgi:hypothetical protein
MFEWFSVLRRPADYQMSPLIKTKKFLARRPEAHVDHFSKLFVVLRPHRTHRENYIFKPRPCRRFGKPVPRPRQAGRVYMFITYASSPWRLPDEGGFRRKTIPLVAIACPLASAMQTMNCPKRRHAKNIRSAPRATPAASAGPQPRPEMPPAS